MKRAVRWWAIGWCRRSIKCSWQRSVKSTFHLDYGEPFATTLKRGVIVLPWSTVRHSVLLSHSTAQHYCSRYSDWAQLTCVLSSTVIQKLWWKDLIPLQYVCKERLSLVTSLTRLFDAWLGTETDQAEYVQKIIDALPLDKLVIAWIQFLTILQNPSECGDLSVDCSSKSPRSKSMRTFRSFFECQPTLVSCKRLPVWESKISLPSKNYLEYSSTWPKQLACLSISGWVRSTWERKNSMRTHHVFHLGKEIDPSCLYSPKPSTTSSIVTMNENVPSTPTNHPSSRATAQSLRGVPSTLQQQQQHHSAAALPPVPGTLKTTRSQIDNRRSTDAPFSSIDPYSRFLRLVNMTSSQAPSPVTPVPNTSSNRVEKPTTTKITRMNRPTVNSLMHLYGPWLFDCCLLQIKDRYSRSSSVVNTNERK